MIENWDNDAALWPAVARELRWCRDLAHLSWRNLRATWCSEVSVFDASGYGMGIVTKKVPVELVSMEARARTYVDDMLAHSRGPFAAADVAGFWAITDRFRVASTWELNVRKSNRFATCPHLRSELRLAAGPAVKEAFADLGVVQVTTARSVPALADPREEAGVARFRRIGRLPVPLARRAQVTGASATSASLYGVGQQHAGDSRLARLRGGQLGRCLA